MADPDLWREAEETAGTIGDKAANRLSGLEHLQLGGGGECRIIYYFTRLTRARHAVETGVAAGWSSAALLLALESNGGESRHLWSSELPYDRPDVVSDYRPFIGLLVADALKQRWSLYLQGDKANIPVILQDAGDIDIFHYDSRKTKRARSCTLDKVLPHMNEGGAIIIDDIGDNTQFATWVAKNGLDFRVFRCEGKYVGVVQLEHTPYSRRW